MTQQAGVARRTRHGLNAPLARVNLKGFKALDSRTVAARSAIAFRSQLVADLGGPEVLSAQRMAIVEAAVRTRLYVDHLDSWLLSQTSLVNGRRKAAIGLLRDRQALVDSLGRLLGQLGLDRVTPPAKDLAAVIREIEAGKKAKAAVSAHVAPPARQAAQDTTDPPERPTAAQRHGGGAPNLTEPAQVVTVPTLRPEDPAYPSAPAEVHIAF